MGRSVARGWMVAAWKRRICLVWQGWADDEEFWEQTLAISTEGRSGTQLVEDFGKGMKLQQTLLED